jgi:hypothetical protein
VIALQEHDIAAWAGVTSLERGRSYAQNGDVFDVRRQGASLKARCRGSLPEPYNIEIELDEDRIVEAVCSCPVGGAGRCKHVAAVLLYSDEEGALGSLLNDCADGLAGCFGETSDRQERQAILDALFAIYRWDQNHGGIDVGGAFPALILEEGNDEERHLVAGWVRRELHLQGETPPERHTGAAEDAEEEEEESDDDPAGEQEQTADWNDSYTRRIWGSLLLDLEGDQMDDATYLATARATGLRESVIERLLARERTKAALAEAGKAPDHELIHLAPIFAGHGLIGSIEEIARLRSHNDPRSRLLPWLQQRARERGDLVEALTLTRILFQHFHTVQYYQELKEAAQALGNWQEEWPGVLAHLENGRLFHVLAEIYLAEGEIDAALRALDLIERPRWGWGWEVSPLPIRVAEAAEEKRPHESLRLYMAAVEGFIGNRNRGAYAQAVQYLLRMRVLYQELGTVDTFARLLGDLRANNPRLRALHDEMKRAGL